MPGIGHVSSRAHAQPREQPDSPVQAYKPDSLTIPEILWAPLLALNRFLFV